MAVETELGRDCWVLMRAHGERSERRKWCMGHLLDPGKAAMGPTELSPHRRKTRLLFLSNFVIRPLTHGVVI